MNADLEDVEASLKDPSTQMRVGRKLRRTLYLHDPRDNWDVDLCVGIVDSELLAAEIVRLWNTHWREAR